MLTGEKLSDIEEFHPDRMTSRILGMGDMLSIIEKAEEALKLATKKIDSACSKGIIKKNTASRKKSNLAKKLNVM